MTKVEMRIRKLEALVESYTPCVSTLGELCKLINECKEDDEIEGTPAGKDNARRLYETSTQAVNELAKERRSWSAKIRAYGRKQGT